MVHTCRRCGLTTSNRQEIILHYKRKTPCEPKLDDIPPQELLDELDKAYMAKQFVCQGCHKRFAFSSAYYTHRKTCTDYNIVQNKAPQAECNSQPITNVNQNHSKNCNLTIDNHVENIHIHINPIDNADTSYISQDFIKKILNVKRFEQIENAMLQACKKIYFNKQHPENMSAYIPNKKNKEALVWDGSEWKFMLREDVIKSMRSNTYVFIADSFDENQDDFHLFTQQEWNAFFNRVRNEDTKVFKGIDKRIGLEFLGNTANVKELIKGKKVITRTEQGRIDSLD
jgi:hypothetical protein